jgi:hypothetical protein
LVLAAIVTAAGAKVADCPPVVVGDFEYSTHDNFVQATRRSSGSVVWKTVLFSQRNLRALDPKLETDVQLNTACIESVAEQVVVAHDRRKRHYRLDAATGQLIGTAARVRPK